MVLASHIIFTCYGFWLFNDPRGSWSDFVRSWELYWYGGPTKTHERGSLARRPHDRDLRKAQKSALQHDPVELTGLQAWHIAKGFAKAVAECKNVIYACAIMPAHVHLVERNPLKEGKPRQRWSFVTKFDNHR